jgi:hypothetical protein
MPTDDWERGYAAGWRAAQRDDVRDITRDLGEAAPKKKRTRKKDPKLSRAMKKAYAQSHKKNGDFKKGWDRSRMLKHAHALRRKM